MFNPTRAEVRQFFFAAWRKHRTGLPLVGLETTAVDIALMHPEYRPVLEDPDRYLQREWTPEDGQTNPFLHMSMHLAIAEQRSIDQPPGIRAALERLAQHLGDEHQAEHAAMECLGEMMWNAQRSASPPDAHGYIDCLTRRTR